MIDPNSGNEMGKREGDNINPTGNTTSNAKMRIMNTVLMFGLSLLSVFFRLNYPVNVLDWLTLVVASFGCSLSYWAYYTLNVYYTFTIGIRKDHQVVTDGPYRYLVHPGYVGQILIILGSIIFYRVHFLLTIGLCLYVTYMYTKRIQAEEDMLTGHFGQEYQQFVSTRWRLFPKSMFGL